MTATLTDIEPDVPADVPVVTVVRRCQIEEVFAAPFIELLALAPRNPIVRGLILAQTRQQPGRDCTTFEQLKDWVETTCHKRISAPHTRSTTAGDGIRIPVEFSETENGRARYSVERSGTAEFALAEPELLEFVRDAIDAGDGFDGALDRIAEEIDDNAWDQCEPELDHNGDYDYDDHNSSDTENSQIEFSRTLVRDRLRAFLRDRAPELLEELE